MQHSTKETVRKKAQEKADLWEKLSKDRVSAKQAHQVIAAIYKTAHKKELPQATIRAFIAGWLARREGEIAPKSYAAYSGRGDDFLKWLEGKADLHLMELEKSHFVRYRDDLATRVSATTANLGIKILRMIFEDARRDGFISDNPAKDCGPLKKSKGRARRPFTVDELQRVLKVANMEWRSMVLFAIYSGQRLGDVARLTWLNIDTSSEGQSGEIHLQTAKTGRQVRIPICEPLRRHIESLPAGDDPAAFIHPKAAALAAVNNSTLSRQFSELLAAAGLVPVAKNHEAAKKGRDARRAQNSLTFHALRHTAVSMMKNAGISPAIVQDLIGHDSAEVSQMYTHVDESAKRLALAALPDLLN